MTKDYLPIQVDPFRFADNATSLHGNLLIKNMQRLSPSVFTDAGEVQTSIRFGVDDQGVRYVDGHVEAELTLQCQRCMEPFIHGITSDFTFGIVNKEERVSQLPKNYDPLIIKDSVLVIQDMIEEELILNLPIVSMHDPKDCKVKLPIVVEDDQQSIAAEKENPFKIIEFLKAKPKQE